MTRTLYTMTTSGGRKAPVLVSACWHLKRLRIACDTSALKTMVCEVRFWPSSAAVDVLPPLHMPDVIEHRSRATHYAGCVTRFPARQVAVGARYAHGSLRVPCGMQISGSRCFLICIAGF